MHFPRYYSESEQISVTGVRTFLALAGPAGIRVGWSIVINGRFEAERPPTSAGRPWGGRAATLIPLSPK